VPSQPRSQLEALHALARALAGGEFRARAVLERACNAVALGFGFERVGIVRYIPESAMLVPFVAHGLSSAERRALPPALPAAQFNAFERAVVSARTIYAAGPGADEVVPEEIVREFGIGSFAIVPLIADARCLGFMTCDQRGEFFSLDESELDLLTTFGTLIAAFLERAIQQRELRRLNELKSQFAALASHELRTPVAAIYGAVLTLDEREEHLTPEQQSELRRLVSQQSKRLFELVENLLDLSRLEADTIRIVPTPLLVAERLSAIVDAVAEDSSQIELNVPVDLEVVVDPQAFDRIVSNLLGNAVRHGAPPIVVSAVEMKSELRVTVEDRGPGIAEEFVGDIFERFTRGPTQSNRGAGLGLSIAQSYARTHGGVVTYEPVRPHGARFHLNLPARAPTD
jgi:signal transduction histidine kinase